MLTVVGVPLYLAQNQIKHALMVLLDNTDTNSSPSENSIGFRDKVCHQSKDGDNLFLTRATDASH